MVFGAAGLPALPRSPEGLRHRRVHIVDMIHASIRANIESAVDRITERFKRRLTEEISGLRVEMAHGFASLRQEIAVTKVELIKWSFVFWTGQVVVLGGLMAILR